MNIGRDIEMEKTKFFKQFYGVDLPISDMEFEKIMGEILYYQLYDAIKTKNFYEMGSFLADYGIIGDFYEDNKATILEWLETK